MFLGRVTDVLGVAKNDSRKIVRFEVMASWKGVRSDTLSLETGGNGGDPGFPFHSSRSYLVYGNRSQDGVPGVSICSRTKPVELALEDSIALGPPIFDRLHGRSWISLGPATTCSIHGLPLVDGTWFYVADLTPDARREYPDWVKREAPFSGMLSQPESSHSSEFTLAGMGTLCPMCRERALAWIRVSQEASSAPETGWDLPVRAGRKSGGESEYRRRFPRAQFGMQYADGRQQFDSIDSTFTRAFGSVRDTTLALGLSEAELDALYEATVSAGLMDVTTPHPNYPRESASAIVRTDRPSSLFIRCGVEVRQFTWYGLRAPRKPDSHSEWGRLIGVYRRVQQALANQSELRVLSPLPRELDDPIRDGH